MARSRYILFAADQHWRVAAAGRGQVRLEEVPSPDDTSLAAVAEQVKQSLKRLGHRGEPVLLAAPAAWCLSATIDTHGLRRQHRRQALLYRFEDKLPMAAEQLVGDFAPGNGQLLAVGAARSRFEPVLDALSQVGIDVQHICPIALLAQQSQTNRTRRHAPAMSCWAYEDQLELLVLDSDGLPTRWRMLPASETDLHRFVQLEGARRDDQWQLAMHDPDQQRRSRWLPALDPDRLQSDDLDCCHAAALAGEQVLAGRLAPWIDLRRDALARGDVLHRVRTPLTVAVCALLLLVFALCGTWLWQAKTCREAEAIARSQQAAAYRQIHPNQALPVGVRSRLEATLAQVRGVSGQAGGKLPTPPSALITLYEALRRMPTDLRYRVLEMRFDGDEIYFDIQTRHHGDLALLAEALRTQQGFEIQFESSRQLSEHLQAGGVQFPLKGRLPPGSLPPEVSPPVPPVPPEVGGAAKSSNESTGTDRQGGDH